MEVAFLMNATSCFNFMNLFKRSLCGLKNVKINTNLSEIDVTLQI